MQMKDENDFKTGNPKPSTLYRFARLGEGMVVPASLLAAAAHRVSEKTSRGFEDSLNQAVDFYYNEYLPAQDHPALLNGNILEKTFNLKPSPKFKIILDRVEEARVLGRITTQEQAQEMAKELIEDL